MSLSSRSVSVSASSTATTPIDTQAPKAKNGLRSASVAGSSFFNKSLQDEPPKSESGDAEIPAAPPVPDNNNKNNEGGEEEEKKQNDDGDGDDDGEETGDKDIDIVAAIRNLNLVDVDDDEVALIEEHDDLNNPATATATATAGNGGTHRHFKPYNAQGVGLGSGRSSSFSTAAHGANWRNDTSGAASGADLRNTSSGSSEGFLSDASSGGNNFTSFIKPIAADSKDGDANGIHLPQPTERSGGGQFIPPHMQPHHPHHHLPPPINVHMSSHMHPGVPPPPPPPPPPPFSPFSPAPPMAHPQDSHPPGPPGPPGPPHHHHPMLPYQYHAGGPPGEFPSFDMNASGMPPAAMQHASGSVWNSAPPPPPPPLSHPPSSLPPGQVMGSGLNSPGQLYQQQQQQQQLHHQQQQQQQHQHHHQHPHPPSHFPRHGQNLNGPNFHQQPRNGQFGFHEGGGGKRFARNGNNHRNRNGAKFNNQQQQQFQSNQFRRGEDARKYADAKIYDFEGSLLSLCTDQHGCRFLQREIEEEQKRILQKSKASVKEGEGEEGEGEVKGEEGENKKEGVKDDSTKQVKIENEVATMLFKEVYFNVVELMMDPFGNYLIQKLVECITSEQKLQLIEIAQGDLVRISLDSHGTRALQKFIHCLSNDNSDEKEDDKDDDNQSEQKIKQILIASFSNDVITLSRDLNGNHVIQKCLKKLRGKSKTDSKPDNQFIFDTCLANSELVACHRHGCCVLQRCLDYGTKAQIKQMSTGLSAHVATFTIDPYANYVVQYVLTHGDPESIDVILNHLKSNFYTLSMHKFGSNVIERSLRISSNDESGRLKVKDEMIQVLLNNLTSKQFHDILNDAYGNYVLQTCLDVANLEDLQKLSNVLMPFLPEIKSTPHGRRILNKLS
ncbi:uncharacterized protein LODBEIA_P22900 [Lodderomyces beijingensis]|uniref:PUM-HD domain-containing protein n=1 Tax=Lodderomyces beijingensis TaxID=1775926 RepID=A0ABP0ZIU5_9ASCO